MSAATLRVSEERTEQLRQIARARGVTAAQVVDDFILSVIAAGEIEDRLPGTSINVDGDVVRLEIVEDQSRPIVMTREEALSLADDLPAKPGTAGLTLLASGDFFEVKSAGRATAISFDAESRADRAERILTRSCAADLSRQLRRAAA